MRTIYIAALGALAVYLYKQKKDAEAMKLEKQKREEAQRRTEAMRRYAPRSIMAPNPSDLNLEVNLNRAKHWTLSELKMKAQAAMLDPRRFLNRYSAPRKAYLQLQGRRFRPSYAVSQQPIVEVSNP